MAINHFHGNLQPPSGSSGRIATGATTTVDVGGAEYLATHFERLRAGHRHTFSVAAGDNIGGTPTGPSCRRTRWSARAARTSPSSASRSRARR